MEGGEELQVDVRTAQINQTRSHCPMHSRRVHDRGIFFSYWIYADLFKIFSKKNKNFEKSPSKERKCKKKKLKNKIRKFFFKTLINEN